MRSLRDIWLTAEKFSPDQIAIVDDTSRRTYREVGERAARFANALHRKGIGKRDRVAMLSMNRAEWYDVYAAGNIYGFIVTTVNFRLAAPEILFILQDSGSKVLVYEQQYQPIIDALRPKLGNIEIFLCLDGEADGALAYEDFIAGGDASGAPFAAQPDDPAHLIYTSGTTGRPKGVIRSQKADASNGQALALSMGMSFGGSMLLIMPMFHIGALAEAHGQLFCRGTVVLHRTFEPARILQTLQDEKIECTHMAPTMVQAFLNAPDFDRYDLSSLKTLCYAAAPMPVTVLKKGLAMLGPVFVDCYGSTELGAATVLHKIYHVLDGSDAEIERLGSVGQASTHAWLMTVNGDGQACAPREVGEVWVKSEAGLDYYWNNRAATMESILDGWFVTGDMGYLDEFGFLYLVDRKKDMIISGGENIYCREVEEALMEHLAVADVAVIGVPDDYWGESVKAIVVLKPGQTVTAEALIEHCITLIARYKRPKKIDFVGELPRLPSGKVNKVALRETHRSTAPAT